MFDLSVLEINVINTMGPGTPSDVSFPNPNHLATKSSVPGNEWASNGNSIRLSGKTIKEYGVEGKGHLYCII